MPTLSSFESLPREIKSHIIGNFWKRFKDVSLRFSVATHLKELDAYMAANPVAVPNGKWFMPIVALAALYGEGARIKSIVSDGEAIVTDAQLAINPILSPQDRRDWRRKLQRIRPESANAIAEHLRDFSVDVRRVIGQDADMALEKSDQDLVSRLAASEPDDQDFETTLLALFPNPGEPDSEPVSLEA